MTLFAPVTATADAPRTNWRDLKPVGAAWWDVIRDLGGVNRKYVSFVDLYPEDMDLFQSLGLLAGLPDRPPRVGAGERDWVEVSFENPAGRRERLKIPTEAVDRFWNSTCSAFLERLPTLSPDEQVRARFLANLFCSFTGEGPQDWPPMGDCLDLQPDGRLRRARYKGWYWLAAAKGDREREGYPRWLYD